MVSEAYFLKVVIIDKNVLKQNWYLFVTMTLGPYCDCIPLSGLTDLQLLLVFTCYYGYRTVSLFLEVWGFLFKFSKARAPGWLSH